MYRHAAGILALGWLWACNGDASDKDDGGDDPSECVAADEVPYDGVDQDCDGVDLDDVDQDGHIAAEAGGPDCDDADPDISPDAEEVPYDGIDQDCDLADLLDADGDGYDAIDHGGDDCDDQAPSTHPRANDDFGNGVDEDCDGADGVDGDQDGHASSDSGGGDCADGDPLRHPDAEEIWYDGVDQNCDRVCDYDADGDGAVLEGTQVSWPNDSPCDAYPGPENWADSDCDDANPDASTAIFIPDASWPYDGASGVEPGVVIVAQLLTDDPTATLTVTDSAGNAVPGSLAIRGGYFEFDPDADLAYAETYTVRFDFACGEAQWAFTVEEEPVPVDPAALVGASWELDLGRGTWIEPWVFADLGLVAGELILEVTGSEVDTLDLRVAASLGGAQDLCTVTGDTTALLDPNPSFGTVPFDVTATYSGFPMPLHGIEITGQVLGGGGSVARVALSGLADTRHLGDLFGVGTVPDATCQLLAPLGVVCEACPGAADVTCVRFLVEDVIGDAFAGGALVPRTQEEIDADPTCP